MMGRVEAEGTRGRVIATWTAHVPTVCKVDQERPCATSLAENRWMGFAEIVSQSNCVPQQPVCVCKQGATAKLSLSIAAVSISAGGV